MTSTVFYVHFRWSFLEDRAREKEKNKLRHHRVISKVYSQTGHPRELTRWPLNWSRLTGFSKIKPINAAEVDVLVIPYKYLSIP